MQIIMSIKVKKEKEEIKAKKVPYFYAVGRRKSATAQIKMIIKEKTSDDDLMINGKTLAVYFPTITFQNIFMAPLRTAGILGKAAVKMDIRGGGSRGQVEAARLAIARAIVKFDETIKTTLRAEGFLTRDSRKVERKKAGLKKARRAPQWQKR
jgi:small subunit ribosomal protein S9